MRALQGPRGRRRRSSRSRPATRSTAPSPAAASTRCSCSAATAASTRSPVAALPGGRGDGQPVTSLIDLEPGTQPAHYFAGDGDAGAAARRHRRLRPARARRRPASRASAAARPSSRSRATRSRCRRAGGRRRRERRVACLTLDGRLLVFGLDELKLQSNGGRGPDADRPRREGCARQRRRLRRRPCASLGTAAAASRARRCCAAPRSSRTSAVRARACRANGAEGARDATIGAFSPPCRTPGSAMKKIVHDSADAFGQRLDVPQAAHVPQIEIDAPSSSTNGCARRRRSARRCPALFDTAMIALLRRSPTRSR